MTSQTKGSSLSLDDLWVDRAAYRPGQAAHLHIVLRNWADTPRFARLNVRLGWLDELVWEQHQQIEIPPGKHDVTLPLQLPPVSFRGYGIDLTLREDDGHSLVQESTALDVLDDWMQAPRYGFLVQFAPGSEDAAAVVATLARYHINVVQFYDWMWRHYTLMPPSEEFIDACGRSLSLKVVREKVTACGSGELLANAHTVRDGSSGARGAFRRAASRSVWFPYRASLWASSRKCALRPGGRLPSVHR